MVDMETIRRIADKVLQNSGKMSFTGLYNGKAGMSLSLFVAAGYLQDERMEDAAHKLFLESLIIKNSDVSFENGLAGTGYAILYLIENKYMEADFDELFGTQYETLIRSFDNIEKVPQRLVNSLQTLYFFSKIRNIKKQDGRINEIIKKVFDGLELFLTVQFHDFTDIRYINRKADVLSIFSVWLKLIDYTGYNCFSRSLIEEYAALYRRDRIVSSLVTGYYLSKVSEKNNIQEYKYLINQNIINGLNNIYLSTLSLRERIDLAKITDDIKYMDIKEKDMLPEIESIHKEKVMTDLLKTVDEKSHPFGYGAGLGRLLIYCVNKNTELL
jgi:hypothetical protein